MHRCTSRHRRTRRRVQLIAAGSAVLTASAVLVALPSSSTPALAEPVSTQQPAPSRPATAGTAVTAPLTPAELQQALEQRALDQLGASRSSGRVPVAGTPTVNPAPAASPAPAPPAPAGPAAVSAPPSTAAAASADRAPSQSIAPRDIARRLAQAHRFNDSQFSCLDKLWQQESRWRVTAVNTHSGAYGIPQALPGSRMAKAGSDWRTNAQTQIEWGLNYISQRYGTPCAAWSHSRHYNWY